MKTLQGKQFNMASEEEVVDFLKSQKVNIFSVSPRSMSFVLQQHQLFLQVIDGKTFEFPVRESCLKKILKWFSFPTDYFQFLKDETLLGVLNDSLQAIKANYIDLKVVNGEAVSINSQRYTILPNLQIINSLPNYDKKRISINDYIMRIYTNEKFEIEPVVGDTCGLGVNIINSEWGFSALAVEHFILRYVCSNGATSQIGKGSDRINHYGISGEVLKKFLFNKLSLVENERKNLIFALTKSNDETALNYRYNYQYKIDSILGKWQSKDFFKEFNWNSSKYDMLNHITHTAKNYDITKRYLLEKLAGELIMN